MTLATVVIPVGLKHRSLVKRAVRSVYAQTVKTDVLVYLDHDKRGPGYGRNLLAQQVRTPFIVTLDADDILEPRFIERMYEFWLQRRTHYVYSDWFEGGKHVAAVSCYGFMPKKGEREFHLPPTLMLTSAYHAIGGYDPTLFGAEDTDFYLRANAYGLKNDVLREPLFHYTPDGYRSKEAARDPRWNKLLLDMFGKYKRSMKMGCCGQVAHNIGTVLGAESANTVLVRPNWSSRLHYKGKATGKKYGALGRAVQVWMEVSDYEADKKNLTIVQELSELLPTEAVLQQAAAGDKSGVGRIEQSIRDAGVRSSWEPLVTSGLDIQQNPPELAQFVERMQQLGIQSVLELGTGDSGGLARYMADTLGWQVTSVDVREPSAMPAAADYEFVLADHADYKPDREYDLVFIDGDHHYDAAQRDWVNFAGAATKVVAMHDVSLTGQPDDGEAGSAKFWAEVSRTKTGNMRKGYSEVIYPHLNQYISQGIGWWEKK